MATGEGEALVAAGLLVPPGHRLVTLEDDPALRRPLGELNASVWPEFMLHDPVVDAKWHHLWEDWPGFQAGLLDAAGDPVAALNSAPLAWDGTDEGLPDGWDEQLLRSVAGLDRGEPMNTLGAIQVTVRADRQGAGYSGVMVEALQARSRAHAVAVGFRRGIIG